MLAPNLTPSRPGGFALRARTGATGGRGRPGRSEWSGRHADTNDLNVADHVARDLRAGVVGVNASAEGDMTTPFGGYQLSGFGGHDKSVHAHDQDTETKTVWIALKPAG